VGRCTDRKQEGEEMNRYSRSTWCRIYTTLKEAFEILGACLGLLWILATSLDEIGEWLEEHAGGLI
jgi:hypothetical protein